MNDDIQNIQNNFSSFTNSLSAQDADYHISVAVTDAGCVYGADAYIDASFSAADASSTLTTMIDINHQNTPYANNTERAFTLLEAFLSEAVDSNGDPNPSGCNYGAIRKQATLALISVSDEPEQSVNNYAHYVSLFQAYKTDPNDVIFHAIGGDYPSGCGSASAYTGYYEATVATGGLFLSICASDWGTHLETLAEGTYSGSGGGITLSNQAVNNSVVVKVDGVTQWAGWTYNEVNNRIEFDQGYAPSNGQTVQVDYTENPCY